MVTRTKRAPECTTVGDQTFRTEQASVYSGSQYLTLIIVCLGAIMTVIDGTALTVALRPIRDDLGFSNATLVWIVNAYLLCYAGFRLLSGRLCDLLGTRKIFLSGAMLFTLASAGCALAHTRTSLIAARAVQGAGGAIITAAALSLAVTLFTEQIERAKALSFFGIVAGSGGIFGLMIGGVLTQLLNWRWIFLINIPIGAVVYIAGLKYLPKVDGSGDFRFIDIKGAILMVALPSVAVYAIGQGNEVGWFSLQMLAFIGGVVLLSVLFVRIEAHARAPIMPLRIVRQPNLIVCVLVGLLLSIAGSAGIFTSLYLQLVLGQNPLEVSFTLLPSTLVILPLSVGFSAKAVFHFGIKLPLAAGLLTVAAGFILLAQTDISGNALIQVLPGTILTSLGGGIAFTPLTLAAVGTATTNESGLISAIMGTSSIFGGTLGLALLGAVAAARTTVELKSGTSIPAALNSGYHMAFLIGTMSAAAAAIVSGALIRLETMSVTPSL